MNDVVIGFHAHQSIEKALKSVLAHAGVHFRRTHAVAELLDLLHDRECAMPPFSERLDELDPYAVEARYGLIEPAALDREATSRIVEAVIGWAETQLGE
jgi:HEPN domain-containing protein